jgi:hypothetical protein
VKHTIPKSEVACGHTIEVHIDDGGSAPFPHALRIDERYFALTTAGAYALISALQESILGAVWFEEKE